MRCVFLQRRADLDCGDHLHVDRGVIGALGFCDTAHDCDEHPSNRERNDVVIDPSERPTSEPSADD